MKNDFTEDITLHVMQQMIALKLNATEKNSKVKRVYKLEKLPFIENNLHIFKVKNCENLINNFKDEYIQDNWINAVKNFCCVMAPIFDEYYLEISKEFSIDKLDKYRFKYNLEFKANELSIYNLNQHELDLCEFDFYKRYEILKENNYSSLSVDPLSKCFLLQIDSYKSKSNDLEISIDFNEFDKIHHLKKKTALQVLLFLLTYRTTRTLDNNKEIAFTTKDFSKFTNTDYKYSAKILKEYVSKNSPLFSIVFSCKDSRDFKRTGYKPFYSNIRLLNTFGIDEKENKNHINTFFYKFDDKFIEYIKELSFLTNKLNKKIFSTLSEGAIKLAILMLFNYRINENKKNKRANTINYSNLIENKIFNRSLLENSSRYSAKIKESLSKYMEELKDVGIITNNSKYDQTNDEIKYYLD